MGVPALVDHRGQPLMAAQTSHSAAEIASQELYSWRPVLNSPDSEILPEWETIVARTRDMVRNHGLASGAVQTHLDNVIGPGLRLVAKPDYKALGQSADWADEAARIIEAHYRQWSTDIDFYCDAGRRLSIDGILAQAYRSYLMSSEMLGSLEWLPRRPDRYATCLQMIQPERLSNPNDLQDRYSLRGGVELDTYGAAVAYHIRQAHRSDESYWEAPPRRWKRVPAETPWGRRLIVHVFDPEQPGQTRGKTTFVSVLKQMKMIDKWQGVSLQSAIINAMYAAVIESSLDHASVAEALGGDNPLKAYMAAKTEFHQNRTVMFDGAKIPHLLPGEQLKLLAPQHPTAAFGQFEEAALRKIAAGLNMSYEQLSRDYSKTNYSSARAALLESWRFFMGRRHYVAGKFMTQIYAAFLEEAIDRGDVQVPKGAPDFYTAKTAWTRCEWIGAPRGHIDEEKEMKAREIAYRLDTTTLEDLCAEQGRDWEEVLEQKAREKKKRRTLGLDEPAPAPASEAPKGDDPDKRDNTERKEAGHAEAKA